MERPGERPSGTGHFGPFFDRRFYDEVPPQAARVDIGRFVNAYLVDASGDAYPATTLPPLGWSVWPAM